jgi:flavin reductase (DIM6/NTAB) family NADH-FMN oxidoreductase RutF
MSEKRDQTNYFHRLLSPRVPALITALREDGEPNTMAATWHTPVSLNPPMVAVAISPSRTTHSLILNSEEFTVCIPDGTMLEKVMAAGSPSTEGSARAKLFDYEPAIKIKTPVISGALGSLECEVTRVMGIGDHSIFVGNVVAAYARDFDEVWTGTTPLLHLGASFYAVIGSGIEPKK